MKNTKAEDYVDFHLRHAWHKVSRMYNQKAKAHGLTMSIGFILLIVDKDGTPSTQLGPRMGMEPTSLSRTLKTMETRGYIYREVDRDDKRKVLIFLTEQGVALRKEVKANVIQFNEKLLNSIPTNKLQAFFEVMETIDEHVEDELKALII
ncbi:MarR family winged helix-turn-helix transcriptional regulator [Brumimicrobium aurantiacum]|uniref:MarR family transcriptional regulator n=1 Tax=Brumimicrobium aurantiacum TaxID=1737063 RepID=A0A3E1F1E7_9FLAO|nr:MarR family transcriptional regulator [Brumimicrobium aurantiacum]RFC55569.1 MarR family transcriptional regulator [Brumimicrobium aurantiacum]